MYRSSEIRICRPDRKKAACVVLKKAGNGHPTKSVSVVRVQKHETEIRETEGRTGHSDISVGL